MAHFAKILNGIVTKVIVAEPEFFDTFVDDSPGIWIRTSYNTRGGIHYNQGTKDASSDQSNSFRKNYACVGYTYDSDLDAFISPQPYPSWALNNTTCLWESPVECPTDGGFYTWNETKKSWDTTEQSE